MLRRMTSGWCREWKKNWDVRRAGFMSESGWASAAGWFLRVALAAGFLSAVADRFGLWGPVGAPGVAWGDWQPFVEYVAKLNWFAPAAAIPLLAWVATIAEVVIAIGLIVGWRLHWFAVLSGLLLLSFALTMTVASGVKAPLDYSVFVGSAASFLLAAVVWNKK